MNKTRHILKILIKFICWKVFHANVWSTLNRIAHKSFKRNYNRKKNVESSKLYYIVLQFFHNGHFFLKYRHTDIHDTSLKVPENKVFLD